jgi:glycosyltransferase involved in cell wall biosynthesis
MTITPEISVVMPCYQQVKYLEEAVRSVLEQGNVEVELIVMDPGSSDGSRELLLSLKEEFKERLLLNFAPDNGQADAINRGMAMARGTVLAWLNSDDRLRPDSLSFAVAHLNSNEPRWLYGRGGIINNQGRTVSTAIVWYKNWRGRSFSITKLITEDFIPQMSTFWNRAMWNTTEGLDTSRHLDMDYDLFLRFALVTSPIISTNYFADFRVHRDAKSSRQTAEHLAAALETSRKYASRFGTSGKLAFMLHRIYSARTRILYWFIKP